MRVRPAAAVLFFLALTPAMAAPLAPTRSGWPTALILVDDDEGTIHTIISDQIQAFLRDDGETAYSFAAPSLKLYFPSSDAFMAMVRNGYQPIYRARRFSFGELKQMDGKFVQSVAIVGPDGDSWRAIYTLVRQEDGSLKIISCYLVKDVTA
ncbi:DUF4864 domain-containing protein [Labrys okinawensis]|uniref:DUF4864 domain-containing protein n=1 Tax=Labrys okinawensis TaxID=346911 RepID=UPI0039BC6D8B